MNPMKFFPLGAFCLMLSTATVWSAEGRSRGTNSASEDDLFAQAKVHGLKIELPAAALESLRKEPRHYVKATVREGSQNYAEVGVRLKGGTNAPGIDKKPGLSLKFNEFVKDQEFHGRSRILLNHAQSDPTYLSEAIASDIFRGAGVPAAKMTFAQVELNGRDLGLYVLAEAINRDFLSQHFKKSKGNLYEGANADVTEKLEKDSGDSSAEQADLRALARAAKEADPGQRWKKLGSILDVDRFIAFVAAEVLVWHQGGYSLDRNNYRIYHDPAADQLVFFPHDVDRVCAKADGPILPEWQGLVAKAVLTTPAGQKQYLEKLTALLRDTFKPDTLHRRVDELAAVVRPTLAEHDARALKAFDAAVPQLRDRISRRALFVRKELDTLGKGQ